MADQQRSDLHLVFTMVLHAPRLKQTSIASLFEVIRLLIQKRGLLDIILSYRLRYQAVYWDARVYNKEFFLDWMRFDRKAERHFLTAFFDKPGLFVESCICDALTRAVSQSYINGSRQIDVNWSRLWHGVGLFRGILHLRQWYDNCESLIR